MRLQLEDVAEENALTVKVETPDIPPNYINHPVLAKLWVRDAYLREVGSASKLAEAINAHPVIVNKWIKTWAGDLNKAKREALADTTARYIDRFEHLVANMLTVTEKSVHAFLEQNVTLSVDQMKGFTASMREVFNITQLIRGQPTEIHGKQSLTWDEVIRKLKAVDIVEYDGINPSKVVKMKELVPELNEF